MSESPLGQMIADRIKLLGYTSVSAFERSHQFGVRSVNNIVKGKVRRPNRLLLTQVAVALKMIPRELMIAAGYESDDDQGTASAFGYDLGTQEALAKRVHLAKGGYADRSSFPLGVMLDRGLIDDDDLRAGLRYAFLHRFLYGTASVKTTSQLLVTVGEHDTEEMARKVKALTDKDIADLQKLLIEEANEMVTALDPLLRAVADPIVLHDEYPPYLLDATDWDAPAPDPDKGGALGRSLAEQRGTTEIKTIENLPSFKNFKSALKYFVRIAEMFHVKRQAIFNAAEEITDDTDPKLNRYASGN